MMFILWNRAQIFRRGVQVSGLATSFSRPILTLQRKSTELHCQGSGPKWITSRPTVSGDLAWGRGKPPPEPCPSTSRKHNPPTTPDVVHTPLEASQAGALLVTTLSRSGHDLTP